MTGIRNDRHHINGHFEIFSDNSHLDQKTVILLKIMAMLVGDNDNVGHFGNHLSEILIWF